MISQKLNYTKRDEELLIIIILLHVRQETRITTTFRCLRVNHKRPVDSTAKARKFPQNQRQRPVIFVLLWFDEGLLFR